MEFGAPCRLSCTANVVGVSWTSTSLTVEADLLVVTASDSISIHAADDDRVVASWLVRRDAARFAVPAVQHREWRTLFAVQGAARAQTLLSWSEREPNLERAAKASLRGEVFALRVSKHAPVLVVVYADGGVGVLNAALEEVASAPRAPGSAPRTMWARLTSLPHAAAGHCVLMIVTRDGRAAPTMRVFSLVPAPAADGGAAPSAAAATAAPPTFSLIGTHALVAPGGDRPRSSSALPPPSLVAVTLHKHLAQLGTLWSDGTLSFRQFLLGRGGGGSGAGLLRVYASAPREGLTLALAADDGAGAVAAARADAFASAAFALEPSCIVLARTSAAHGVSLTVWDVRFGVSLGSIGGMGGAGAVAPVSQVTVSEDGSFVAAASSTHIFVTPVAVRGASLASALGRAAATRTLLRADTVPSTAPIVALADALRHAGSGGAGTAATGQIAGALEADAKAAWLSVERSAGEETSAAVAAALDASATPTAALLLNLLAAPKRPEESALSSSAPPPAGASARRPRRSSSTMAPPAPALELPPALPSPQLVDAIGMRCERELARGAVTGVAFTDTLLPVLLGSRALSPTAIMSLLRALLTVAPAAPAALTVFSRALELGLDANVPESLLVSAFRVALATAAESSAPLSAGEVGAHRKLFSLSCALVRAPRNDVFLETALRSLTPQDATALLVVLARMLELAAAAPQAAPSTAAAEPQTSTTKKRRRSAVDADALADAAAPALVIPPLAAIADWIGLLIDAHFATFVVSARGARESALVGAIKCVARVLEGLKNFSSVGAPLLGALAHFLGNGPLPIHTARRYDVVAAVLKIA